MLCSCSAVSSAARAKPTQKKRSVLSSNGENFIRLKRTMKSRSMPTNRTVPDVTCIRSLKETGVPNKGVSVDKKVSERTPCYRQASDLSFLNELRHPLQFSKELRCNSWLIVYSTLHLLVERGLPRNMILGIVTCVEFHRWRSCVSILIDKRIPFLLAEIVLHLKFVMGSVDTVRTHGCEFFTGLQDTDLFFMG